LLDTEAYKVARDSLKEDPEASAIACNLAGVINSSPSAAVPLPAKKVASEATKSDLAETDKSASVVIIVYFVQETVTRRRENL
jgi:hypothetical protein